MPVVPMPLLWLVLCTVTYLAGVDPATLRTARLGVMVKFGLVSRGGLSWWWPLVPVLGLVLTEVVPWRRTAREPAGVSG